MNSRFSRFLPLLGGLLFGLGAAALLQAFTWPGLQAGELLREKMLVLGLGNFGLAFLLVLVLAAGGRILRRVPSPSTGFWVAFAFGAAPLAAFTLGPGLASGFRSDSILGKPVTYGYLAGLLLLLATPLAARLRGRWEQVVAWGGVFLLFAWGALWFLFSHRDSGNLSPRPFPESKGLAAAVDPPRGFPDLVLISIDTFRADAALEDPEGLPHFAELRRRGRWASYALAPAPSTLPSHTTMLTGVEVLEHGARSNEFRVPDRLATLAELLHARGYRTAGVVSNGVLRGAAGFSRGFEVFDDLPVARGGSARLLRRTADAQTWLGWFLPAETTENFVKDRILGKLGGDGDAGSARGERTTEVALHYLDVLRKDERPFFLFIHFMDPHQPYHPDPSVAGRLTAGEELPAEFQGEETGSLSLARRVEQALGKGDPAAGAATGFLHDLYREEILF
ncbi:MAG: sulfatase-like hydrolase/transferase, partial [Planctomycetota bacterium]